MSWASTIPKELTVRPVPSVVLTGLDVKHNAIHKEIWDGFNLRNNQKFRYALLDGDHEYPKTKNKRPTEFYIPKGIFKANWLNKHLYLVPSLVVVFFDLDWDEPNWKEKQMECATKVELVRHSLLDRNTRIILILIQRHPNIPVDGDNVLARERYPALCAACSIKNNYLFLLHAEHVHGYIIKLEEDAFTEPTQTYYTLEIKAVKFKRDSLIKVTHQFLFVRLAMKIAFFNEMKLDTFKAIEYYKQAYLSLLDIRIYDTNIFEIKTVAGMINYKLCQLFFEIKHPIDAIDQFRKHIDIFRIKVGPAELAFEHSAWLSNQFQLMGEIFEDAIKKGYLSAVQTQHPGFYFHSAANHAIQRRLYRKDFAFKSFYGKQWTDENRSPIEFLNNLEFYGQRPWRQGQQGMEILDQQKERDGIICLQELESNENLTPLITELFRQAITHFKVFNCKRMKQYLSVCMAEEYFFDKEYQESLKIYVNVLNDYNNEHWWPILTSIISNALKCAFLVADITNYCLLCIELIGKNVLLSPEEKSQIQSNLLRVIANEAPLAEPHQIDSNQHSIEDALVRWKDELLNSSQQTSLSTSQSSSPSNLINQSQMIDKSHIIAANKIIPADVSGMVPFVECKVRFLSPIFNSNQFIELSVYMRTNCIDPIQFNKLNVRFNLSNYNQNCIIENSQTLMFTPNKIKEFKFKFLPQKQDIGKDLEISSISLELGNRDTRVLIIHWKGDCKNALTSENHTIMSFARTMNQKLNNKQLNESNLDAIDWNSILILSNSSIVARKANIELKLEHKMPIFVDEYYAIKLSIENKEENSIENLTLTAEFQASNQADKTPIDKYRLWIGDIDPNQSSIQASKILQNIESNKQSSEIIYVQLKEIISVNLLVKVSFNNENNMYTIANLPNSPSATEKNRTFGEFHTPAQKHLIKCTCVQEDQLKLESIYPFKFDFSLLSMQMKPLNVVRIGEPFLLLCDIKNDTPYSLKFKNSYLKPVSNIKFKPNSYGQIEEIQSFLKDEILKQHEMATECFCLIVDEKLNEQELSSNNTKKTYKLGEYLIEWRRKKSCTILKNLKINGDSSAETNTTSNNLHDGSKVGNYSDVDDDEDEEILENEEKEYLFNATSSVKLPEINVEPFPFLIETILPNFGYLDEHLVITYTIKNKTQSHILDLECNLDENEFFSVAANKLEFMQIMPNDSTSYSFVVYPLQSGYCKLPKFHVKLNNLDYKPSNTANSLDQNQQQIQPTLATVSISAENSNTSFDMNTLDPIIQNMIPSQIFIMPQKVNS